MHALCGFVQEIQVLSVLS